MRGVTIEGVVNEDDAGVRLKPKTTAQIEAYIWSISQETYKRLQPDVQPIPQRNVLCRYACDTVLVKAELQAHKEKDTDTSVSRASEPTPPAPHGPSPTENQGVLVNQQRNERNEPVTVITRPVPEKITLKQLQGICPKAINTFTQTKLESMQRGQICMWPVRMGTRGGA